jgi:serine/threonine-protein kinase
MIFFVPYTGGHPIPKNTRRTLATPTPPTSPLQPPRRYHYRSPIPPIPIQNRKFKTPQVETPQLATTDIPIVATNTRIPATNTRIPTTDTSIQATNTLVPPTDTSIPPTDTPLAKVKQPTAPAYPSPPVNPTATGHVDTWPTQFPTPLPIPTP